MMDKNLANSYNFNSEFGKFAIFLPITTIKLQFTGLLDLPGSSRSPQIYVIKYTYQGVEIHFIPRNRFTGCISWISSHGILEKNFPDFSRENFIFSRENFIFCTTLPTKICPGETIIPRVTLPLRPKTQWLGIATRNWPTGSWWDSYLEDSIDHLPVQMYPFHQPPCTVHDEKQRFAVFLLTQKLQLVGCKKYFLPVWRGKLN